MATPGESAPNGMCPACGRPTLERRRIRDEFDYGPAGERVRVVAEDVPVLACAGCGEVFYGPEAEQVQHRALCRALGLMTPEQIRGLRERSGRSQAEFARLTGIGVATLSRWEQGRLLPSRSMDRYLRILEAVPDALRLWESHPGGPGPAEVMARVSP